MVDVGLLFGIPGMAKKTYASPANPYHFITTSIQKLDLTYDAAYQRSVQTGSTQCAMMMVTSREKVWMPRVRIVCGRVSVFATRTRRSSTTACASAVQQPSSSNWRCTRMQRLLLAHACARTLRRGLDSRAVRRENIRTSEELAGAINQGHTAAAFSTYLERTIPGGCNTTSQSPHARKASRRL